MSKPMAIVRVEVPLRGNMTRMFSESMPLEGNVLSAVRATMRAVIGHMRRDGYRDRRKP